MEGQNCSQLEEIPKSQAKINEEMFRFKDEITEAIAKFRAQHEEEMADIHSKLDALIDYFRMRSKGIETQLNFSPNGPTILDSSSEIVVEDPIDDEMLEVYEFPDSEGNGDCEFEIKHSLVEADSEFNEILPLSLVEEIGGDERNAGINDNGGAVLSFTHLEQIFDSEGEGTVNRLANGLLNGFPKAWFEESTSGLKAVLSQNAIDHVARKVFDEMSQSFRVVLMDEQVNDPYTNGLNFNNLTLFDPGGGREYAPSYSKGPLISKAHGTCINGMNGHVSSLRHVLSTIISRDKHCLIASNHFHIFRSSSHLIFALIINSTANGNGFTEMDLKALFEEANSELLMRMFSFDPGGIYVTCLSKGVVSPLISKALRTYVDGIKGVLLLIRHPISFIDAREKHYVIGSIYFLWSDRDDYIGWGRSVRVPGLYIILEECKDSLYYVLSICPETELYGICSIILSLSNGMIRAKPVGSLGKCKISRSLTYNDVVFSFDPGGSPYILKTGKWSGLFYSNQGGLIEYTAITLFGWSLSYWFSRRVRPPSGNVCVCVVYCCFHVACGLVLQFRFEVLLVFFPFQTSVLNAKYMGHWLDLFINVALDDKRGKIGIQGPDHCNSLKHVKWINMALDFDVVGLFWMRRCNSSRIEEMRDPLEYLLGKDESKCFMIMLYSHHSSSECKYLANVQHNMLTVCVAKLIDNEHSLRHALFSDDKVKDLSRISFSKFPKGLDHVDSLFLKYVIVKLCQVKLVWLLLFDKGANEDTVKAIDGTVFKCFLTIGRVCYATFRLLIHVRITSKFLGRLVNWWQDVKVSYALKVGCRFGHVVMQMVLMLWLVGFNGSSNDPASYIILAMDNACHINSITITRNNLSSPTVSFKNSIIVSDIALILGGRVIHPHIQQLQQSASLVGLVEQSLSEMMKPNLQMGAWGVQINSTMTFCIQVELAWPVVTLVDSKGNRTFVVLTLVECAEEDRKHYNVLVNPYDLAYIRVLQVHLYKTCLFIKLAHFTANQATLEEFCCSTGTTISKNFVWDPGVFHLTTLRTRRLLRGRICHVPRLKIRKKTEDALLAVNDVICDVTTLCRISIIRVFDLLPKS